MDRREAVKYITILMGGTVIGADAFLTGCKTTGRQDEWTPDDISWINELGESILPQTSSPGAKAANVGQFMTVMVNDCYEAADQKVFREGIESINKIADKKFGKSFMAITPEQRNTIAIELDKEAKEYSKKVTAFDDIEKRNYIAAIKRGQVDYRKKHMSVHYFTMMKQLTLLGFFTSQLGATQAVRYLPVPGRYDGCVPYKKGDKLIV